MPGISDGGGMFVVPLVGCHRISRSTFGDVASAAAASSPDACMSCWRYKLLAFTNIAARAMLQSSSESTLRLPNFRTAAVPFKSAIWPLPTEMD